MDLLGIFCFHQIQLSDGDELNKLQPMYILCTVDFRTYKYQQCDYFSDSITSRDLYSLMPVMILDYNRNPKFEVRNKY